MEATGVAEGVQAVEVGIKGLESAVRITGNLAGWTIKSIAQLVKFILAQSEKQKHALQELTAGEMNLEKILKHNEQMGQKTLVMQMDESIYPEFVAYCQSNGLSYSRLKDLNLEDGQMEIVYPEGQEAAFNVFISKWSPHARAYSFTEYSKNATPDMIKEADAELSEAAKAQIDKVYGIRGSVTLPELARESDRLSAVTLTNEQYQALSELGISFSVINDEGGKITAAITDRDVSRYNDFFLRNSISRQTFAEYVLENPSYVMDSDMAELCKNGNSHNLKTVTIDKRQLLANHGNYFVEVRLDGTQYITVPYNNLYVNELQPDKLTVLLPRDENISVYDRVDNAVEGKIQPEGVLSAEDAAAKLEQTEQKIEAKKSTGFEAPLAERFINEPVREPEYLSAGASQGGIPQAPEPKMTPASGEPDVLPITININRSTDNNLLVGETKDYYFTRVPRSDKEYYMYIDKSEAQLVRDKQTLSTSIDTKKTYNLHDRNGNFIKTIYGRDLYNRHYGKPINYKKKSTTAKPNVKPVKPDVSKPDVKVPRR